MGHGDTEAQRHEGKISVPLCRSVFVFQKKINLTSN